MKMEMETKNRLKIKEMSLRTENNRVNSSLPSLINSVNQ